MSPEILNHSEIMRFPTSKPAGDSKQEGSLSRSQSFSDSVRMIRSSQDWSFLQAQTPSGPFLNYIFDHRKKFTKIVEIPSIELMEENSTIQKLLAAYEVFTKCGISLIERCYIIATDSVEAMNSSLISFSYPGLASLTFNVGEIAVLPAKKLFPRQKPCSSIENQAEAIMREEISNLSFESYASTPFSDKEWENSLSSSSPGKELMQSTTDVSELFEQGKSQQAKLIDRFSSLEVLQCLYLSQFLSKHLGELDSGMLESFRWQTILHEEFLAANTGYETLLKSVDLKFIVKPDLSVLISSLLLTSCEDSLEIIDDMRRSNPDLFDSLDLYAQNGMLLISNFMLQSSVRFLSTPMHFIRLLKALSETKVCLLKCIADKLYLEESSQLVSEEIFKHDDALRVLPSTIELERLFSSFRATFSKSMKQASLSRIASIKKRRSVTVDLIDQTWIVEVSRKILNGLKIRDRRIRFKVYSDCFISSELIKFLVESSIAKSETAAVDIAMKLWSVGVIHHVSQRSLRFENNNHLFRFSIHETRPKFLGPNPYILYGNNIPGKSILNIKSQHQEVNANSDASVKSNESPRNGTRISPRSLNKSSPRKFRLSFVRGDSLDSLQVSPAESNDDSEADLSRLCQDMQNHIRLKDIHQGNKLYNNCFTGQDVLTFMKEHGYADDEFQALQFGQKLVESGAICHVSGKSRPLIGNSDADLFKFTYTSSKTAYQRIRTSRGSIFKALKNQLGSAIFSFGTGTSDVTHCNKTIEGRAPEICLKDESFPTPEDSGPSNHLNSALETKRSSIMFSAINGKEQPCVNVTETALSALERKMRPSSSVISAHGRTLELIEVLDGDNILRKLRGYTSALLMNVSLRDVLQKLCKIPRFADPMNLFSGSFLIDSLLSLDHPSIRTRLDALRIGNFLAVANLIRHESFDLHPLYDVQTPYLFTSEALFVQHESEASNYEIMQKVSE